MQRNLGRLKKEMNILSTETPHGVSCWPLDDNLNQWEAMLIGVAETPYEGGVFRLKIQIPERYYENMSDNLLWIAMSID